MDNTIIKCQVYPWSTATVDRGSIMTLGEGRYYITDENVNRCWDYRKHPLKRSHGPLIENVLKEGVGFYTNYTND